MPVETAFFQLLISNYLFSFYNKMRRLSILPLSVEISDNIFVSV